MRFAALLFIAGIFGLYAVTAAAVLGVSLQRLIPRMAAKHMEITPWFKLVKTANNTFLILGIGAAAILFNEAAETLITDNIGAAAIAATALAVRWITKCYRAMRSKKEQPAVLGSVEAVSNFVLPVAIVSMGVYALLGHVFWLSLSGWALMVSSAMMLITGACTFLYWKAGEGAARTVQAASRASVGLYALTAAVAVQLIIRSDAPHLLNWSFAVFIVLVACTLLWQGALMSTNRTDHGIWWYIAYLLFLSPILFAISNGPWVLYGHITADQSFGGLYGQMPILALLALLVAVALSVVPWILSAVRQK